MNIFKMTHVFKMGPLMLLCIIAFAGCMRNTSLQSEKQKENLNSFVNPFLGTGGHGHVYPGATVPFGMIQLSPDNGLSGWDWCSGYHYSDSLIAGFSHLHLSGTGIGDLADILFMPVNKKINLGNPVRSREDIPYISPFSHAKEKAEPGYYQVYLEDPGVEVQLSTTERTGFHKYVYKKDGEKSFIVDLGFSINWDSPINTQLNLEDPYTLSGFRHSTGWAKNQKVFFVAKLSQPVVKHQLFSEREEVQGVAATGQHTSGQFYFPQQESDTLLIKVSLSSVSIENAKENMSEASELNFQQAREKSAVVWNEALSDIVVETPVDSLKTIFYTALYHAQLAPVVFSDINGAFRKVDDQIGEVKDFDLYSTLSLWDTFRAQAPLMTLIEPERVNDIVNSFLVYYQQQGVLPVWNLYGNETNTMTGYHSIPIITEAYMKGIRDFDVEQAYQAMKKTMMQDDRGLSFYKEYGYIPYDKLDESVTITLEYAYNDWCVAQMAKALGKEEDYQYFLKRSLAYQHLFDPETGFMRGKSSNTKDWNEPFDPKHSRHREDTDYTEGNAWQHSWFVLHDVDSLIQLHGGKSEFTSMLEQLFTESSEITGSHVSADISGLVGQYAHGNEPSHHIAYLFNKADQPWRTQYWVRKILTTQYSNQPDGLSGNEDAGQMSAWYVFSSLGLYPLNPASGAYEIGSPLFEESVLRLPSGENFKIVAEGVSSDNFYVQEAFLNGEVLNRSYITHQEIMDGGELVLKMGSKPGKALINITD